MENYNEFLEQEIVDKINELYITNRKLFLKMNNEGKYSTINYTKLNDSLIEKHIKGIESIGVFSGSEISKFICFDIDMIDKSKMKWIYHLLMESLFDIGFNEKYIHTASSGNKGLHVLIFVKDGTSLKHFKFLFTETMKLIQNKLDVSVHTKLFDEHELKLEIKDICNIEFRPTNTQGVKLELGINFKNKDNKSNRCLFVNKQTLNPIKNYEHILSIKPMPKEGFMAVMDFLFDQDTQDMIEEDVNLIRETISEPYSHKLNKNENETIEYIINLIQNGLYMPGTRHNSVLKIAKYFRYCGLELEDCIVELTKWMKKQNKKYYSISPEGAISECARICKVVYEKEYSLVGHVDNLKIFKSELKEIINIQNKNDKILLYSMLIHSKRYSLKNGVFYMTYKQIEEMCDIGDDGARQSMKRLVKSGFLEIISQNERQENNYKHKPNKYRINLNINDLDEIVLEIDNTSNQINYSELYYKSIIKSFTNSELKHLPIRQYNEFTKLRKSLLVG